MVVTFRDLAGSLRALQIPSGAPLLVHSALSAFGDLRGGPQTFIGALLVDGRGVMMPTFTYKAMVIPEDGPPNNGLLYGSGRDQNQMAEIYQPGMPADPAMGIAAETLRRHPNARRSSHPILSFAGLGCGEALAAQLLVEPLAPLRVLSEKDGWVILAGIGHIRSTAIHYAEKLAGRKQFIRWALTTQGVRECQGWPGCSEGFEAAGAFLEDLTHTVQVGDAIIQALPLKPMVARLVDLIRQDPFALLCEDPVCERCSAVRQAVSLAG